jgi:uncharacterized membrane protein
MSKIDRNESAGSNNHSFNSEDLIQIVVGSSLLVAPVAFSEEAWKLSISLPIKNIVFLLGLSLSFIGMYVYQGIFSGNVKNRLSVFVLRIFIDYLITLFVVFIILLALNKIPIDDPVVAFKRIILIGFPASLVGVVLDGMDKE